MEILKNTLNPLFRIEHLNGDSEMAMEVLPLFKLLFSTEMIYNL